VSNYCYLVARKLAAALHTFGTGGAETVAVLGTQLLGELEQCCPLSLSMWQWQTTVMI